MDICECMLGGGGEDAVTVHGPRKYARRKAGGGNDKINRREHMTRRKTMRAVTS